jgi:DNA-binding transcriptional ArsR family regulator
MENVEEIYNDNSNKNAIDSKLDSIHKDLKRLMERSNKEYLDLMLANLKREFYNSINSYISDDIETRLERSMVNPCDMRKTCKSKFTDYLLDNKDLILKDNVSKDVIDNKRIELAEIKKDAPFNVCENCFSEVSSLFDKQLDLISSIKIYNHNDERRTEIASISDEIIVKKALEPLSNKQRLQILKSMASETRTFSSISELTGLRGGNLLFHLQKLLETDLILQRHERGDYMITQKGFKLLLILVEVNKLLEDE